MNEPLIEVYLDAGLALVPIPHGQKGPRAKGWNLRENTIRTAEDAAQRLNGGNVGLAHAYCEPTPTCAIDLDDLEKARPWLAARGVDVDALLAAPDAVRIVSGRPGRDKLLYRLPHPLQTHKIDEAGLELRCAGKDGKTVQDVLPPSIHPTTGQPYRLIGDIRAIPPIPDPLLAIWENLGSETRRPRLEDAKAADPLLRGMIELGMVRSDQGGGKFYIACPFADQHTMTGGEGETAYFLANTGGYAQSHFHCFHTSCEKRSDAEFSIAVMARFKDAFGRSLSLTGVVDTPSPKHLTTDLANAQRLHRAAGTELMFAAGRWYFWMGTHWAADEAAAYRTTCNLSALIHAEADEWEHKPTSSKDEANKNLGIVVGLRKWAKQSEMKPRIDAAFTLLRRLVEVPVDRLDADPYLLNVENGTIDLRTGILRPHDKADRITKLIPIRYDTQAKAVRFEQTLAEITGEAGFEKKPVAAFLQRWFGYCVTGLVNEQMFAVHYGDGANGKSLLLDTISRVLGAYAGAAAPNLLVGGASDRHPTELADLCGRRMVTAHESGEDGMLREEFIKRVTGGDRIKARYMRQDFIEFDPTHKLQLVTNHKPQVRGQDYGIWRRVLLVHYKIIFGTPEAVARGEAHYVRNEALAEALKAEAEGILAWIVHGAVKWHLLGLTPPDSVLAAGMAYREEQDRVGQFVAECCERDAEAWTPLSGRAGIPPAGLYPTYQTWCRENGYQHLGRMRFQDSLEKRPGVRREERHHTMLGHRKYGLGYWGLRLISRGVI